MSSSTRRTKIKIALVLVFTAIDLFVSTVFLIHWDDFSQLSSNNYKFCTSAFDLWVIALSRCVIILGAVVGFLRNKRDAIPRIASSVKPMGYFQGAIVIFLVVKFLMSTECHLEKTSKIWLWGFSAWNCVCSVLLVLCCYELSKIEVPTSIRSSLSTDKEISDVLEREKLLGDEDTNSDDENSEQRKKSSVKAKVSMSSIFAYSKPDILYLLLAFFFLLTACAAQIFIPYYTGKVIDGIAIKRDRKMFEQAILIMSLIALVEAIAAGLRGGIFSFVCARFNIRINNTLFGSILKQEIGFFDKSSTGEIVSRLTSDTTKISDQITLNLNVFLRSLVKGVGVCIFMFKLSWKLAIVTLIGLPIIALVSDIYGEYYRKLSAAVQDSVAEANEVVAEVVSSMKTVRSFANEDGELNRYKEKNSKVFRLKVKEAICFGGYSWCTEILILAMEVIILFYGGHLVLSGELTGGNLVSFILYQLELSFCLEEVGDVYTGFMEALGAAQKVFKLIKREPKILNNGSVVPLHSSGEIEFKNVTFSYPTRPEVKVLNDVSFTVKAGQVVALVGSSGGGKSTTINLLQHFYEPQSGEVLIDSIPVQHLDHKYLHKAVSLVGQEPVLFSCSIKENIAYGIENLSKDTEAIEDASRLANAHDFISTMPKGYETEAGEKGLQLSGGQKQRIAIARSLIRKPQILLLDEATSALDAESEHLVQDAIYNNLKGHTVMIIAHRLSTIEKADKIIVIDNGQVVEYGTHVELMAIDGTFSKLVQRQLLGSSELKSLASNGETSALRQTSSSIGQVSSLSSSFSSASGSPRGSPERSRPAHKL
ncbi:ATP-binding cassette sub-family B member 9-like [Actinia tenebrosa]|uniref:ATP-binding cassette sub-family B member 9-like n=1 Tax=Actinia tenebrosa TaxID=6105 RepID=A0A6P8IXC0_ACTTE|nr:ATP-binding cassette sub-family B member 9-like [Actinia tenebrosa]